MQLERNKNQYGKIDVLDGIETLDAQNCTVNFPLHQHETYNITLVLKNTFRTNLVDKSFLASQYSLAITNPNEFHATPCDAITGNSFFTFYVPPSIITRVSGQKNILLEDHVLTNPILFNQFLWLSKEENQNSIQFEKHFLAVIKHLIKKSQVGTSSLADSQLRQFIKEVISEKHTISLNEIENRYGINKFKFIRLFKDEYGLTPKQYSLFKRIEKSKKMLQQGYPILDVAIICDFYDSPHFYKYFKHFTGVNPQEFQAAFIC